MPPVRKPKPQMTTKAATPTKAVGQKPAVVSGQLKKKLPNKPKRKPAKERGVVLVRHLPHGFFEQQLSQYFKQFGHVTRVRLARSERTGGSKGYAFVEFEYPEVAKVAAETMDNYLMFQKVVKAKYIPPENQKFNYFKNTVKKVTNKAGKEIYVSKVTKDTQRSVKKQNNWNEENCQKRTVSGISKLGKIQKKYEHLGIDFSSLMVQPVKKSEAAESTKAVAKKPAAKKAAKKQPEPKLEDLLGNTINEDSDDEDFELASDDGSEEEADSASDLEESEDDEEEEVLPPPKKTKKQNTGAERLEDIIKRKPGTGGIQKKKPAVAVKKNNKASQQLQLAAAKQLAKPLNKVGKKLKK
ncbi:CG6937 [Drosophila busckii]|uniref:CG6937 n=1 Tax=Drosophila busckii TaxID=30019 RepID=A0A0M4EHW4_DROBS|nr:MKI67 FHA domain-interacting nucleolar phosphoprotein [Drosophila busckii]ALC46084.1 CG6937 [Drosophila busckii]